MWMFFGDPRRVQSHRSILTLQSPIKGVFILESRCERGLVLFHGKVNVYRQRWKTLKIFSLGKVYIINVMINGGKKKVLLMLKEMPI